MLQVKDLELQLDTMSQSATRSQDLMELYLQRTIEESSSELMPVQLKLDSYTQRLISLAMIPNQAQNHQNHQFGDQVNLPNVLLMLIVEKMMTLCAAVFIWVEEF